MLSVLDYMYAEKCYKVKFLSSRLLPCRVIKFTGTSRDYNLSEKVLLMIGVQEFRTSHRARVVMKGVGVVKMASRQSSQRICITTQGWHATIERMTGKLSQSS